jgi:hypothetical protein
MKSTKLLLLLTVVLTQSVLLPGQVAPNLENGFKPYGSYDGGSLDTVNVMTET